jgi:hypothetical protein
LDDKQKIVTLKRTINLLVIVTEDFKKYLLYELEEEVKRQNSYLKQIEENEKQVIAKLEKQGEEAKRQIEPFQTQVGLEKAKTNNIITNLNQRIEETKNIPINTLYNQGTLEGLVNVKIGDNIYQKMGALEIIVKDGLIQEIRTLGENIKK